MCGGGADFFFSFFLLPLVPMEAAGWALGSLDSAALLCLDGDFSATSSLPCCCCSERRANRDSISRASSMVEALPTLPYAPAPPPSACATTAWYRLSPSFSHRGALVRFLVLTPDLRSECHVLDRLGVPVRPAPPRPPPPPRPPLPLPAPVDLAAREGVAANANAGSRRVHRRTATIRSDREEEEDVQHMMFRHSFGLWAVCVARYVSWHAS